MYLKSSNPIDLDCAREPGVDIAKILAMLLIVLAHCI